MRGGSADECGFSLGAPDEQFADNMHGQATDEFKSVLMKERNALLWLLPAECTDETQPVDAGYGRDFQGARGQDPRQVAAGC